MMISSPSSSFFQIKVLPLFKDTQKFEPDVDGQKLQLDSILVYYVDEKAPTFTMKRLTGGVIAVIVVVVLAVIAGLVVLVSNLLAFNNSLFGGTERLCAFSQFPYKGLDKASQPCEFLLAQSRYDLCYFLN